MVSTPPQPQVGHLGQTTTSQALTTTQRVPTAATMTTTGDHVAVAGLTTQQIAAHGLTGQLTSTGQLITSHGIPKQLITTQSPVIASQAVNQTGVAQLIGGQVVTQAVVGGTLVTTQANNQVTAQVKEEGSPTNNTATVAGSSSGKGTVRQSSYLLFWRNKKWSMGNVGKHKQNYSYLGAHLGILKIPSRRS